VQSALTVYVPEKVSLLVTFPFTLRLYPRTSP
jgi:hypothetical protein